VELPEREVLVEAAARVVLAAVVVDAGEADQR
jgi:hypothetical protein